LQIAAADGPTRHLVVVLDGKYPLYDVSVRIVDLAQFEATQAVGALMGTTLSVGNLSPKLARLVGQITLPDADQARYNVFIMARNDPVTELLRLRRVNGEWKIAMRVQKDDGETGPVILKEQVDPAYPLNNAGQVDW